MTNQTPAHPRRQSGTAPSPWAELTPLQRAGLVVTVLLLPCLGGIGVIGTIAGLSSVSDGEPLPSARRFAEVPPAEVPPLAEPAEPEADATETTPPPARVVRTRTVTVTRRIPYATRAVRDKKLPKGTKVVRIRGASGVRTLTYRVTVTDGRPGKRRLIRSVVVRRPVTRVIVIGTGKRRSVLCDQSTARIIGFVARRVLG
ncbi:G5 domain-containing protein [Krasilnikovia sp. M28-CT-15]|uniref:G5 domain-containing protein n=1 Tax=Krasilnikovia sp. M28-CT-15 TaxID=3373540 RepID=UPI003875E933